MIFNSLEFFIFLLYVFVMFWFVFKALKGQNILLLFESLYYQSGRPTTLIYDMHWNDRGRGLIAQLISQHLQSEFNDNLLK